ncbi:MAG: cold-shock protein [Chitinophagales bacterium]
MGETWNKKEREKKKQKEKQDKAAKMQGRKDYAKENKKSFGDMIAYIDENGNLSPTPPDPRKKVKINVEDIQIGVPKQEDIPEAELIRNGKVTFFNDAKGFGFIKDSLSQESVFVHANNLEDMIQENDKVSFELQMGQRGPMAVNVKKVS